MSWVTQRSLFHGNDGSMELRSKLRKGLCRRDPTPPPPLDSCLRRNDVSGPSSHQVMSPTPTGERGKLHGNADDAPLQPRHLYRLVFQVCEGRRLQRLTFVYTSAGVGQSLVQVGVWGRVEVTGPQEQQARGRALPDSPLEGSRIQSKLWKIRLRRFRQASCPECRPS